MVFRTSVLAVLLVACGSSAIPPSSDAGMADSTSQSDATVDAGKVDAACARTGAQCLDSMLCCSHVCSLMDTPDGAPSDLCN